MADNIILRRDAQRLGLKRFFTGEPCSRGHIAQRQTSSGSCLVCHKDRMRTKGAAKAREAVREWRRRNPDFYKRLYAASEGERARSRAKRKSAEQSRRDTAKWRERHPARNAEVIRDSNAVRRACVPPWADREAIKAIYQECRRITRETGIEHHVDHIIPVRGRRVCGLHVPENLRIITARENLRKSNRLPEMLEAA